MRDGGKKCRRQGVAEKRQEKDRQTETQIEVVTWEKRGKNK